MAFALVGSAQVVSAQDPSGSPDGSMAPAGSMAPISGDILFYDTSGGPVWDQLSATLFKNFTTDTGVTVSDDYNEAATKFFAGAEAGQVPWSLVFMPTVGDAANAAKSGFLEPIDKSIVPVDKLVEGTYDDYGIQVGTFGMVLAWNDSKYTGTKPSKMADLFDTTTFPGKRCFFNDPQYGWTLEAALLADGVAPADLYPLDVTRALAKLDTIKNDIVWWSGGAESVQDFENGSCDIGILWANRALGAKVDTGFPMAITWDQGGYANSEWSIPAGAPNKAAAQQLLAHVINDTQGQIDFASKVPTPIPAQVKDADPNAYPEAVRSYLPVGANIANAIAQDGPYYEANAKDLLDQFNRWLAQ